MIVKIATVLGSAAAMGYANAIAWRQVQDFNRSLETQVAERTSEIRTAMADAQRLADDLAEKNHLLEDAYRDIAALDHVKNELITRLSSELRAPVTSLLTAAKILNRSKDAPLEKNARFVEIIYDEAEKMSEIIQSIFQASVLAGGADAPERRDVPAEDLIRRAIAPLRDLARQREVRLHILIPSGLSTISCEGESAEAALRAVIKNAIEFNHNGGQVKLEVRRVMRDEKPWLMLCVTDTGVGIPDQELAHVCEAFWQGGNVLSGKPRGVGLGLAIAKRVAEHHGGSLLISSTVAEGTEVTMTLPQFDGFHSSKI